tara:strand:- start:185 stop:487 length:303 start_codon:yes stop_codon:yes gene_type:complete
MLHVDEGGVEPGQTDYLNDLGIGQRYVGADSQIAFAHHFFNPILNHEGPPEWWMKIAPEPMDEPLCSGSANGNPGVSKSQEIGIFTLIFQPVLTRVTAVE